MKTVTEESITRLRQLERDERRDLRSVLVRYWLGWAAIAALAAILFLGVAHANTPPLEQLPDTSAAAATVDPSLAGDDALLKAGLSVLKGFGSAVAAGEAFVACVLACVLLVILLRLFGKRIHDAIPDDHWADKPFFFLFDSKPGGVLLNALTSAALSVVAMLGAGVQLTAAMLPALLLGTGGVAGFASALYGWGKDFWEYLKKRKLAQAEAAGALAAAKVETKKAAVDELNKL